MTPLEYIETNPNYEESRMKWLVFDDTNKRSLIAKQVHVKSNHKIKPIQLTDGRWACRCDIATEIGERGICREIFSRLDRAKLATAIIMEDADVQPLIPTPPEEQ